MPRARAPSAVPTSQVEGSTSLEALLADQPEAIQEEIVRINTQARPRALQVALCIPILAAPAGLATSFRMRRLPGPESEGDSERMVLGERAPGPRRPSQATPSG